MFHVPIHGAPGRLLIVPRPRGGDWLDDDIARLARAGVHCLVSLLEPHEQTELELEGEPAACGAHGVQFAWLPVPDRGTPGDESRYLAQARLLAQDVRGGRTVACHCRQSVGRAGMLAVAVSVMLGSELTAAVETVSLARGVAVPETPEQRAWLHHRDSLLRGARWETTGDASAAI